MKRFRAHPISTASSMIRHEGDDRLSSSTWMVEALEHLMEKHFVDLADDPRARSRWCYKLAKAYGLRGRRLRAVRSLARSIVDDLSRWPRFALVPAFALGSVPARWALAGYAIASQARPFFSSVLLDPHRR